MVSETEEAKTEVESLRQQLLAAQETLTAMRQGGPGAVERGKGQYPGPETNSGVTADSVPTAGPDAGLSDPPATGGAAGSPEELCRSGTREGGYAPGEQETSQATGGPGGNRQRELEAQLRQREDEVRELEAVRAEVCAQREAQEGLAAERDELRQRLGDVEHQLALSQAASSEDHAARIRELSEQEAQLTSDLRQQTATVHALQERVQVAQESLNQTTQVFNVRT